MKTTVSLTIHAPSRRAAARCLKYIRWAWNVQLNSGLAPADAFLECGEPKGIQNGKKKK